MKSINGTKTEENLFEAFSCESRIRNKYTFYAAIARKDGYEQIASIFEDAANNEKEHARVWFKLLNGGTLQETKENLKEASSGENNESEKMYKRMAAEAREEGFNDIAFLFESIGMIEKEHELRFLKLLEDIESNNVFNKEVIAIWVCRNCGFSSDSERAPERCSVCELPQAYFELREIKRKG